MSTSLVPDKYAPVSLEPVVIHGVDTGKLSVTLDDPALGKTPVGIVGKNYGVWSNHDAVKVAEEVMHRSRYSWEREHEIWDGKHFHMFWKTADNLIELPEVGDAIQLGLRLENSYDGTCKLRIAVMAYVLTCTNGMISDQRWGIFSMRHDRNRDVDWADAVTQLQDGATNLLNHAGHFRTMTQRPFALNSLLSVAADSSMNPTFVGKYVKALSDQHALDTGSNGNGAMSMWDAVNTGTHLLSQPDSLSGVRQLEAFTDCFLTLAANQN